jgi:hypothetical protein
MAGVDTENQFPNSLMANAVKLGQSRLISSDVPNIPMGEQNNVSTVASTALTIPTVTTLLGALLKPTYAVVTALTGAPLYYTIDGTTPSATNNAGQIFANGNAVPFYGLGLLQALKFITSGAGTMSVGYYR